MTRARNVKKVAAAGAAAIALVGLTSVAAFEVALNRLDPPPLKEAESLSVTVVDRRERLLRAFTTKDGRWRLPVAHTEVDKRYLDLLFAFEDKRFWEHAGVDVYAAGRATLQLIEHRKIISGASTLTMQVARLLDQKHERTASGKLAQALRAVQLERRLTKGEILDLYLRLAPFGGNIEGVRAASLAYFGREPQRLSLAQAALLVALPQSPETRRPDRSPDAARIARNRVLKRGVAAGVISEAEAEYAMAEPVPQARRPFPMLAPHLAESERAEHADRSIHRLTIDRDAQATLEELAGQHARALGPKLSAAIIAVENGTGEIIAQVGSADYFDAERAGAVDMTRAIRSPGSTLKPVIYGLGFEAGLAHPETLIEDRPIRFGAYRPENFDDAYHGTVTIREALGQSLNVPAVAILDALGPERLIGRLKRYGLAPALPDKAHPSLAVALGGVGLSLRDLAGLYAGLANEGQRIALTHIQGEAQARVLTGAIAEDSNMRLLSPVAAWYVGDILKDAPPPANTRGGRIAYKTGTSYGYRDALAIGYDGRYTIAVWIGRPDATSTPGLTGRTAAAPLLFEAFARLDEHRVPLGLAPAGVLKVSGNELPPPLKRFGNRASAGGAGPFLAQPVTIAFPPDRSELEVGGPEPQPLLLKAEGGQLPLTWLVDGRPLSSSPHRREVLWQPGGPGFARVSVIDAAGRVDRVTIRLQ